MDIRDFFESHGKTAVAFSGGVDSAVLLMLAKRYAKSVRAYYVRSQFQPRFELEDAERLAASLGAELCVISLDVLSDSTVRANPENRCYFCKRKIFTSILNAAKKDGFDTVLDGTNASDNSGDRPGMKALSELKVLSPLRLCGYTKADIRRLAKEGGLFVFDKPSYACLATRVPTDTEITQEILSLTEEAEAMLMKKGFKNFRIRYQNGGAKLEFGKEDMKKYFENKDEINALLKNYYSEIYPDPQERADE